MLGSECSCDAPWVWIPGEGLLTAVVFFLQGKCENSFAWEEMDNLDLGAGHLIECQKARCPALWDLGSSWSPWEFNLEEGERLAPSYLTANQSRGTSQCHSLDYPI